MAQERAKMAPDGAKMVEDGEVDGERMCRFPSVPCVVVTDRPTDRPPARPSVRPPDRATDYIKYLRRLTPDHPALLAHISK